MNKYAVVFILFLSFIGLVFACSQQKDNMTVYIEDKVYNWGTKYEWMILSSDHSIFYTLDSNNNGKNKLTITTFDKKWNSTSEEIDNVEIGQIKKVKGNVVSIIVNGKKYNVLEELYPKTNLEGIFDVKWGDSLSVVVDKLEKKDFIINIFEGTYEESLKAEFSPEIFSYLISKMSDIELKEFIQNIKMDREFASLPAKYEFVFSDRKFFKCLIDIKENKSNDDFKKVTDYLIREYGKPSNIESDGKIFVWFFDDNYYISAMLSTGGISLDFGKY